MAERLEVLTVTVDGVPHPGILKATVTCSAESAVREAVIEADEPRGQPRRFRLRAKVVLKAGGDLLVTGTVSKLNLRVKKGERAATVTVKSTSAKAVKTAARAPDFALKKKSVGDAAKELFRRVGVPVTDEAGGKTFNWKWGPGQGAFDVIETQARAANLLTMGDAKGGIVIAKGVRGAHAGVLAIPGEITEGSSDLSDENEFSETTALGQTGLGDKARNLRPKATAKAKGADDGTEQILLAETEFDAEDLKARAKARRSRRKGSDVSCTLPVPRWRDTAGRLWEPAYTIRVAALEDLEIDQDMAIKSVVFRYEKGGAGSPAELNLVDPPSLNGKGGKSKSSKEYKSDDSEAEYEEDV